MSSPLASPIELRRSRLPRPHRLPPTAPSVEARLTARGAVPATASITALLHAEEGATAASQPSRDGDHAPTAGRLLHEVIGCISGGPRRVAERYHEYAADAPCDDPAEG